MFWSTEARPKSLQGHRGQAELTLRMLKEGAPTLQSGACSSSALRVLITLLTPPPEFGVQCIDEARYIKDILSTIGFDFIIKLEKISFYLSLTVILITRYSIPHPPEYFQQMFQT